MTLDPQTYAPFASPEEYIVEWTDRIWEEYGLGRLDEHYADDVVVHTALGPIRGREPVLRGSLVKKSAFPNRIGTAEDVICEPRGTNAFVSHHRVLHVGLQEGTWLYGPPSANRSAISGPSCNPMSAPLKNPPKDSAPMTNPCR